MHKKEVPPNRSKGAPGSRAKSLVLAANILVEQS